MAIKFGIAPATRQIGQPVNMEEWNARTMTAGGAVGFGAPVGPGSGDQVAIALVATNGTNVLGITFAESFLPHAGDAYAAGDNMTVAESCVVGVKIGADAVTAAGAVARWDTVNAVWTPAAQSSTVVTIPGAQFDEPIAANGVGALRYRRPIPSLSVAS